MSERLFRKRRRYILIDDSPDLLDAQVFEAIRDAFQSLYGIIGLAESGFKRIDVKGCLAISCYKEWVPRIILAISLVREAAGLKIVLKTIRITGTIRSLVKERGQTRFCR